MMLELDDPYQCPWRKDPVSLSPCKGQMNTFYLAVWHL